MKRKSIQNLWNKNMVIEIKKETSMNKRAIAWTQSWKEFVSRRIRLRGSYQQRDPDFERAGNSPKCGTKRLQIKSNRRPTQKMGNKWGKGDTWEIVAENFPELKEGVYSHSEKTLSPRIEQNKYKSIYTWTFHRKFHREELTGNNRKRTGSVHRNNPTYLAAQLWACGRAMQGAWLLWCHDGQGIVEASSVGHL